MYKYIICIIYTVCIIYLFPFLSFPFPSYISLLILTNLKFENGSGLFQELKDWLQLLTNNTEATATAIENSSSVIQIRDQLCAGFFLIYCKKYEESKGYLEQVEELILPEYFEALKGELEKRQQQQQSVSNNNDTLYTKYSKVLLFIKEFASALLEKMKTRHSLLVAAIRSNVKNFVLFCKKLIEILLRKLRIL